jgi:hypothetical protein
VSASTPPFAATYAASIASPFTTPAVVMFTIEPPPFASIAGISYFIA